ncbi:MAG: hypothetical protein O3C63_08745, partial [Cyanobacteria bacterium]|nr:hypothetical protein [Cyanobacteriota bacterium]
MAIQYEGKYDDYGDRFEKTGKSRRKFDRSEESIDGKKNRRKDRASQRKSHRATGPKRIISNRHEKSHSIDLTGQALSIWSAIPSKTQIEGDFWADIKAGHRPTTINSDKASRRAFVNAVTNSTFFLKNRQDMKIRNLGALMKCFGACSYDYNASDDRQSTAVRLFLNELETVLIGLDQVDSFSLSHIIYGLTHLDNSDIPRSLIAELTNKVEASDVVWSWQDVAMALFGLRTIADDEVQDILNKVVSKLTKQSKQNIDAAGLITAIKMRPPSLIKPLSDKVEMLLTQSVFDHMSETALANTADAMASLPESNSRGLFNRLWSQWLRVESPAALASLLHSFTKYNDSSSVQFVKEIANKIRNSQGKFTTVDIAKCFIGLHDKKFVGLDELINFLTITLKRISKQLDPQRFHDILSGCR